MVLFPRPSELAYREFHNLLFQMHLREGTRR
jgi:hypothetical protein